MLFARQRPLTKIVTHPTFGAILTKNTPALGRHNAGLHLPKDLVFRSSFQFAKNCGIR